MNKILTSKGPIEISLPTTTTNAKGEVYMICPICNSTRRPEHQKEKKLAVNIKKSPMMWRCNHCTEYGAVITEEYMKKAKVKPMMKTPEFLNISEPLVKWFWEKRKISIKTLKHFDISLSLEPVIQNKTSDPGNKGKYITRKCINFKYKMNSMLVNIKFRDPDKNFKMVSGASLIPFNIDSVLNKDTKRCVIVEGEIDCMAYHEVGIKEIISVPNGAAITEEEKRIYENTGEIKVISNINLEYLDLVIDRLSHIEEFIIATDDDPPGVKLREELARRLGYERCKYIKFGDYRDEENNPLNDPNELLIKKGKDALFRSLEMAVSFPIDNVSIASDHLDMMIKNYREGKTRGVSTGYETLDPHFNWVRGWPIVFNGFPNMGKTSFVINLIVISAVKYNWKWGIYCPENYPIPDLIETFVEVLIGKTIKPGYSKRVTEEELKDVTKNFIDKYFFFIDDEDGYTPEKLRNTKKRLIRQYGIVGFLTDPWTSLNHDDVLKRGGIDEYTRHELNAEVRLTTKYNLINVICHHPKTIKTKTDADKPPAVFELTGGKYWWIKMYAALTIHQEKYEDWKNNRVGIHSQKIKIKQIAGETTNTENYPIFEYDKLSCRFFEQDGETKKYNKFPFNTYLDTVQKNLFEGF
jgi:twinkle protein